MTIPSLARVGRFAAAVLLCLPLAAYAVDRGPLLDRHDAAKVDCAACHKTAPGRKPAAAICLACHGGEQKALAAKTASAKPNPHAPPHLAGDETQDCNDCHHLHKPSELACNDCHRGMKFNVK